MSEVSNQKSSASRCKLCRLKNFNRLTTNFDFEKGPIHLGETRSTTAVSDAVNLKLMESFVDLSVQHFKEQEPTCSLGELESYLTLAFVEVTIRPSWRASWHIFGIECFANAREAFVGFSQDSSV